MILSALTDFIQEVYGEATNGAFTTDGVSISGIVFIIVSVFVLGLIVMFTYKATYQTTVYNKSFAVSLPLLAMISAVIIITVSSNLVLSLGMVGALSIVRFRTAIKNPLDTVYMFWVVGIGITAGAGFVLHAAVSTVLIAAALFALIWLEVFTNSFFLIIRGGSPEDEEEILAKVKEIYGKFNLRNKTVKKDQIDLTLEVRSKDKKYTAVNDIQRIESVRSVILLSHQGDYISE